LLQVERISKSILIIINLILFKRILLLFINSLYNPILIKIISINSFNLTLLGKLMISEKRYLMSWKDLLKLSINSFLIINFLLYNYHKQLFKKTEPNNNYKTNLNNYKLKLIKFNNNLKYLQAPLILLNLQLITF
jgi:hypothetical protein